MREISEIELDLWLPKMIGRNVPNMNSTKLQFPLILTALSVSLAAQAQQMPPPDVGRLLQEQPSIQPQPLAAPNFEITIQPTGTVAPGGQKIKLTQILFTGNNILSSEQLQNALNDAIGQEHDLAGLQHLTERLSEIYRQMGYPFVRAILPPQTVDQGMLRIQVVEGKYGQILAAGPDADINAFAQRFLHTLRSGDYIRSDLLERTTLIIDDQPGFTVAPVIRPGVDTGTGDLLIHTQPERGWGGQVGIENHGSRYVGQWRANASLFVNHFLIPADQLDIRLMQSELKLSNFYLGYSLPVGAGGWRANASISRTHYELGREFSHLQAHGRADVLALGLSYPIIRRQRSNLLFSSTIQNKEMIDRQQIVGSSDDKSINGLQLGLQFDHRDALGGGGISFGQVQWHVGSLRLGANLLNQDVLSGRNTRGEFDKWTFNVSRLQATAVPGLVLFGRVTGQMTNENLDSSEGFGLGGPNGVRAYPNGEAFGDEGWLLQLETRYNLTATTNIFAFYDQGSVATNANTQNLSVRVIDNTIDLAGYGLGVRFHDRGWSMDASLAWRSGGQAARSDRVDRNPRLWLNLGYRF